MFAAARKVAQRVQLGAKAVANETALAADQRAFVRQGLFQPGPRLAAQVELLFELRQQLARSGRDLGFDGRQTSQRPAHEAQITGAGAQRCHAGQESLQIVNAAQLIVQGIGQPWIGDQFGHRVEPRVDAGDFGQGIGQPVGQEPGAHRRHGAIHDTQQRSFAASIAQRADDFQTAPGRGVDLQRVSGRMVTQRADVRQRCLLGFDQIAQYGAGRANRRPIAVFEAKTLEVGGAKMILQHAAGRV